MNIAEYTDYTNAVVHSKFEFVTYHMLIFVLFIALIYVCGCRYVCWYLIYR